MPSRARWALAAALLHLALAVTALPAAASLVVPPADDDLIVHAEVIVVGQVTRIESHLDDTDNLWTYVTLEIEETLKGALPGPQVTLKERGGRVGDRLAWVFANPQFRLGERALLFLDQHDDGALRTFHLFLGKFTIVADPATGDLVAARGVPRNVTVLSQRSAAPAVTIPAARPLEDFTRRIREKAIEPPPAAIRRGPAMPFALAAVPSTGRTETHQEFRFLVDPDPGQGTPDPNAILLRWHEPDNNQPVVMRIDEGGEPLAPTLGFEQIRAALRIWGRVPTSSFRFAEGPPLTIPGQGGFLANGISSIAFRDPSGQIPIPVGCGGVLAIAGISRAEGPITTVNGRNFFRALEGDLVVADGWDGCGGFFNGGYYQSFSNFAEVITHELGHILGLGHSADATADPTNLGAGRSGATMRPIAAFDGRAAALHIDDRAGVSFIYPAHTLTIFKDGPGTVTSDADGIDCGTDCVAGFAVGSAISLTATPAEGFSFAGFLQTGCGTTVVMDENRVCTASFTAAPDLAMSSVSAPAIATPGSTITVTNTVRNNGHDVLSAFNVGIYLSSSSAITPLNPLLGTRRVTGGLAFNAQNTDATLVSIPGSLAPGTYVIGAIADSDDEVDEGALENNNARAATQSIVIGRPDLVVTTLTTPATAGTGMSISASVTVTNRAALNFLAPPSTLAFYLSTDATLDVGDTRLGATRAIPQLARNASSAGTTSLTIPADQPPGTYFLIAHADDLEVVDEENETNNARATATQITIRGPDLEVRSVTAPTVAAAGVNVTVTHVVRNVAAAPGNAAGSTSRLYLSTDSPLGGELELGSVAVPALAAAAQTSVRRRVQIPASTPAGVYRIFAQANALDTVIEAGPQPSSTQPNNRGATTEPIIIGPDLVVAAATAAPTAIAPGRVVNVTSSIRNQGGGPALPFSVGIYLSRDTSIDASDVLVATRPVAAGLAPAATATAVTPVTIPSGTEVGTYFLIVRADHSAAVAEANETNNDRATTPPLLVGSDLLISAAAATPAVTAPGRTVVVANTVRNAGAEAVGPFDVAIYLSADNQYQSGVDVLLATRAVSAGLAARAVSAAATPVVIPADHAAGNQFLIVRADTAGAVTEGNENNNTLAIPLNVVRADLVITALTAPSAAAPGMDVSVSHTVRNAAAAAGLAGPTTSRLYLSTSPSTTLPLDAAAVTTLLDVPVGPLAGMTQAALIRRVQIPAGTAPGRYWIVAEANATRTVVESVPANNASRTATPIIVGPDLVVSAAAVTPAASAPGLTVNVSNTVRNQGGQATPPFTVGIYLSTDSMFDGTDILLASRTVAAGLRPGATSAAATPVVLPDTLSSTTHVLFVQVDVNGQVTESDQTNNTRMVPVAVVRPNLTVASLTAPTAAAAGASIRVTHVVRNVATAAGASPSTVSRLFLSTDQILDGADVQLGEDVPVGPLAGQGQASLTRAVQVPPDTVPGLYFLLAQADAAGTVVEAEEGDNTRSRPIVIGPDVTLTGVSTVAATIPGATINVVCTLRNLGAVAAGPFDVGFTLVPVAPPGPDIPIGPTRTGIVLAGAGTRASSTPVVVPADIPSGQYRVRITADVNDAILEAVEDNNAADTGTVTITPPDLDMASIVVPGVGVAGRTIGIATSVTNTATPPGTSPAFQVGLYLSTDPDIDPATATLLGSRGIASLAPGATSTATMPVVLPVTPGHYFIGAVADRANVVIESDESDNRRSSPIDVLPAMVRTRAASVTVTTSSCLNPANAGTRLLNGTLAISSQTGPSWTGTVSLPSNTVTLRGSVDLSGNITGTFTVVNAGGARGSGSFAGSAGSGPAGGLTAGFNGAFTVGEACTISASLSVI